GGQVDIDGPPVVCDPTPPTARMPSRSLRGRGRLGLHSRCSNRRLVDPPATSESGPHSVRRPWRAPGSGLALLLFGTSLVGRWGRPSGAEAGPSRQERLGDEPRQSVRDGGGDQ